MSYSHKSLHPALIPIRLVLDFTVYSACGDTGEMKIHDLVIAKGNQGAYYDSRLTRQEGWWLEDNAFACTCCEDDQAISPVENILDGLPL